MNSTEAYEIELHIRISHNYYKEKEIPVMLTPTKETAHYLANRKKIFRRLSKGEWIVLCPAGTSFHEDEERIRLQIHIVKNEFYYVTPVTVQTKEDLFTLEDTNLPGIWKIMEIHPGVSGKNGDCTIHWEIPATEKFFEFICIPRYNPSHIRLSLRAEKGEPDFREPEKTNLPDGTGIIQFVSRQKITLRSNYRYKIKLWEIRETGERLISDIIPAPLPDNISLFYPEDTITSYYYF